MNKISSYDRSEDLLADLIYRLANLPEEQFFEPELMAWGWKELGIARQGLGRTDAALDSWNRALSFYRQVANEEMAAEVRRLIAAASAVRKVASR